MATVIVDASFCPAFKCGAWAAWVTMEGQRIIRAGVFKTNPENSIQSELWAAVNGVYLAVNSGAEEILVQSDCMFVVENLKKHVGEYSALIATRHVKGHSNKKGKRYYVNRWCDKTSRKLMREKRENLRSKNETYIN